MPEEGAGFESVTAVERSEDPYISQCLEYIEEIAEDLELPQEAKKAAAESVHDVPPRIRQHYDSRYMAAAALQLESRKIESANPRTIKQISLSLKQIVEGEDHLSNSTDYMKKTRRTVKKLKHFQGLDLDPELAENYLPHILDRFDLPDETRDRAWNVLKEINGSQELQSKSQIGIASAIAYIAAEETGEEVSVEDLAELACRSKKTIRDSADLIKNQLLENGEV